jgi:hypothetical protein
MARRVGLWWIWSVGWNGGALACTSVGEEACAASAAGVGGGGGGRGGRGLAMRGRRRRGLSSFQAAAGLALGGVVVRPAAGLHGWDGIDGWDGWG